MKKILFLTTGGTIASSSSEEGLVPSLTSEEILHYLGEHHGDIEITCQNGNQSDIREAVLLFI